MANIEVQPDAHLLGDFGSRFVPMPRPRCAGCGAEFVASRDPRLHARGPAFSADYRRYGTCALEVAAFAREHAACPAPRVEVTTGGVTVTDRRRW